MKFKVQITAEDGSEFQAAIEDETDLSNFLVKFGALVGRHGWTDAIVRFVEALKAKLAGLAR
jgi:hypothetical protein